MDAISWAWVPITLGRALAQTLRNAAQRHLTADLGALGATLVRFLYGLPFAVIWLAIAWVGFTRSGPWPAINAAFLAWTVVAALSQIAATALLLRNMEERNFAIGVAYSKSEISRSRSSAWCCSATGCRLSPWSRSSSPASRWCCCRCQREIAR